MRWLDVGVLCLVLLLVGCRPHEVNVSVDQNQESPTPSSPTFPTFPGLDPAPGGPGASGISLRFFTELNGNEITDVRITMSESVVASVFVVATNSTGTELPPDNFNVTVRASDAAIVASRGIDGRTLQLEGLSPGGATVTVSMAGGSRALPVVVVE